MAPFFKAWQKAQIDASRWVGRELREEEREKVWALTVIRNPTEFEKAPEIYCHSVKWEDRSNLEQILNSREWPKETEFNLLICWF